MVPLCQLSQVQLYQIQNHDRLGKKYNIPYGESDTWHIVIDGAYVKGDTFMDNFDMETFLDNIGVKGAVFYGDNTPDDYDSYMVASRISANIDRTRKECKTCEVRFACFTS